MTPAEIEMVQDSFKKVVPIADIAANIFYDRLFEIAPQVRPLFPADMKDQKTKLMQTIGVAVNNLHKLEDIVPVVQELGRKHVNYGVKPEHYDIVAQALLFTLSKGLGDAWSPALEDAWTKTYTVLATTMKDAAAEVEAA